MRTRLIRTGWLASLIMIGVAGDLPAQTAAAAGGNGPLASRFILDMVHYNPGEPRYATKFADPRQTVDLGCNGKVFFLFDSPTLAVNWDSVDPDLLPKGSPDRAWVDAAAARVHAAEAAAKAQGLKVYAMTDMVLFPKRLIAKRKIEKTFGDPNNPVTAELLRKQVGLVFDQFPDLDGLVVRIGETYLQDAPFHQGKINNAKDVDGTVIPLVQLLRDEICVKRHKTLIFRTWLSFDTNMASYLKVSDAVEPDPNLIFGVKHCEGDFFRGKAFSRVIGQGRHPQLIEVQCSREYEGKGSYPNYIANGVIEGFEEHRLRMQPEELQSIGAFARHDPRFAGIWTWSRGGGWGGPFIKNEMWPELNAWVMDHWAADVRQTEESVFNRCATEKFGLKGDDVAKFRKLALLSADAVLRGRNSTMNDIDPIWSRDAGLSKPKLPTDEEKRKRVIDEKDQSVEMWKQIVEIAKTIDFPDAKNKAYAVVSSEYGLDLYRATCAGFHLADLGPTGDPAQLKRWLAEYDAAMADYNALPSQSDQCATLYKPETTKFGAVPSFQTFTDELRPTTRP